MGEDQPTGPRRVVAALDDGRELELRAPRVDDAGEIAAAVRESLDDLRPFLPWATAENATTEWQFQRLIKTFANHLRGEVYAFHVFESDSLVGAIYLARLHSNTFETGYWVRSSRVGQGLCTAMARAVVAFGFDYLDAERVEALHAENNEASGRVLEKAGFIREGVRRGLLATCPPALREAGCTPDAVAYSLTRADRWPQVALTVEHYEGAMLPRQSRKEHEE
mmetsp:Transcript_21055/g.53375  ORF Transcript_21055/g.53375 Transcript_21055/m.53375 type:complete len:223 (-) Transcript_21055:446-1114(-)